MPLRRRGPAAAVILRRHVLGSILKPADRDSGRCIGPFALREGAFKAESGHPGVVTRQTASNSKVLAFSLQMIDSNSNQCRFTVTFKRVIAGSKLLSRICARISTSASSVVMRNMCGQPLPMLHSSAHVIFVRTLSLKPNAPTVLYSTASVRGPWSYHSPRPRSSQSISRHSARNRSHGPDRSMPRLHKTSPSRSR